MDGWKDGWMDGRAAGIIIGWNKELREEEPRLSGMDSLLHGDRICLPGLGTCDTILLHI